MSQLIASATGIAIILLILAVAHDKKASPSRTALHLTGAGFFIRESGLHSHVRC